jgi:uncharacterized protein (DUF1015 family)
MDIQAFRGWRYDLGRVGALGDVVAPPYDVIDAAMQDALYARHPRNVIRLDLNKPEPADSDQQNRYTRAARLLKDWQHEGILREEGEPAIYVYHQIFKVEGKEHTRRGVLARVRLERFGEGRIYAHEETMPGPKADRLSLMRATGMNLSPIFGLYPDPANAVQNRLADAVRRTLPLEAVDHLGTVSRLWPITDQKLISIAKSLLYPQPVFIADGHHRYETALRYQGELHAAGAAADPQAPANFTLMMLVGMSDPGLLILPTHRLVSGIPDVTADRLKGVLEAHFDVAMVGKGPKAARDAWEVVEAEGEQNMLGFGTVADDTWLTARFRTAQVMDELAADHSPAWRGLAVSILHVLVLNRVVRDKLAGEPSCKYVHLLDEATAAVAAKECQLAVLVPPVTMSHVELIAGNLEKMPPKSTYFYPKLLTGLVFNPVR